MREGRPIRFLGLLCALLCVLSTGAFGQSQVSFPDQPRYTVERLADQFGLGAVTVTAMGQDAQGFLWIGTQTGLYRYDGVRAEKMGEADALVGHYVVDLVIAPDGTPWFAGNRGIAHYNHEQFQSLPIPPSAMPLGAGTQLLAVDSKGVVYALLFGHGILRVDSRKPGDSKVLADAEGIRESVT